MRNYSTLSQFDFQMCTIECGRKADYFRFISNGYGPILGKHNKKKKKRRIWSSVANDFLLDILAPLLSLP